MKILITSGGTDVPIDDVRKISNMSSGKYGAQIAKAFYENYFNENEVLYFGKKGGAIPESEADTYFQGRKYLKTGVFSNFDEYLNVVKLVENFKPDIIISAAAVSDYILDKTQGKISSNEEELVIKLRKAPKVLPLLRNTAPNAFIVGFKLLVSPSYQETYEAVKKVFNNGADLVVYNDLTEIRKGNSSRLVFKKDMTFEKADDASQLVDIINKHYVKDILTLKVTGYGL